MHAYTNVYRQTYTQLYIFTDNKLVNEQTKFKFTKAKIKLATFAEHFQAAAPNIDNLAQTATANVLLMHS